MLLQNFIIKILLIINISVVLKYLIEGDDNKITCQKLEDNSNYYTKTEGDKAYYRKCSKEINYCNKCSNSTHCKECLSNYAIIDDNYLECKDLSSQKYYLDTDSGKYKLCSYKFPHCEKCFIENNDFICKQCSNNFVLKHDDNNIIQCTEKTELATSKNFFTNDTGNNYYSCASYNNIKNCGECQSKEKCDKCKNSYTMLNKDNTDYMLCVLQNDIDSNLFAPDKNGLIKPCYSLIPNCNRCNNSDICYECQGEAALIDNNTCISKIILEENKKYFKDNVTNKYISCSVINNCVTCESSIKCLSCQEGFDLNNGICNTIISNDDNDNKLSTGAIIGIVFGCLGFLVLVGGVVYFLINKYYNRNINDTNMNNDIKIVEEKQYNNIQEDKDNDPEVINPSTKRTIHNSKV